MSGRVTCLYGGPSLFARWSITSVGYDSLLLLFIGLTAIAACVAMGIIAASGETVPPGLTAALAASLGGLIALAQPRRNGKP